jgi:hypothetical protein
MNKMNERARVFSDGEIFVFLEHGRTVHIEAITPLGDPVELSAQEMRELAECLIDFEKRIE